MSLYLNRDKRLSRDKSIFVASVLKRRMAGEPIQYILNKTEFMGLKFKVTPDVLIPRPETEILVEEVIKYSRSVLDRAQSVRILDLGTGSGCIAVSLAKFLPGLEITAVDISSSALKVAKSNARLNNVTDKINFIKSDLFSHQAILRQQYDIIVSNPPYISFCQMHRLQSEVKNEPWLALYGGIDGLDFYRRIISGSPQFLKNGGLLIMEIGFNQKEGIKNIFVKHPGFNIIGFIKDYNDIERIVVAKQLLRNG